MPEHLSVTAILSGMANALPIHPPSDDSSDLASSYEAIALLIHSYLTALGFKLLGFDEDKKLPECESLAPRLPPQWNSGLGSYSFLYSYKQSAMVLSIRVNPMGKKVEIQGLALADDNICRIERSIGEVVKSDKLPIRITTKDNEEDRSDVAEKLWGLFTSEQAIAGMFPLVDAFLYDLILISLEDILHDVKLHIIQKLIPKLQSKGYIEPAEAEANARSERRAQVGQGPNRPCHGDPMINSYMLPPPAILPPEMARPRPHPIGDFPPPGFENEYEMNRPPRSGLQMPGRSPYNTGHDDLNPPSLGPHDPLRDSFTGGLPQPGAGSDHLASILKYRLERDGIPLALVETQDSPILVPEGKTTYLAETSFKYSGISLSELPGMNKKVMHIEFNEQQTLVIRRKAERTYTSGNPPASFVEGLCMHEAMKGDGDEHNKSQPEQPKKCNKHDEKTKYWLADRSVGEFSCTFSFPSYVDQDSVNASFQDGIMSIIVPMVK
ncbi:30 kDa heat shock protein [Fusarium oxysporum f. sp. rapae]|uniref:30 kDa heat shock protein n=1 Tax=Fusarium oxysporum f. sp. rapae TaxID=485398 RepID=A0A8J5TN29_FUSOX|nr:30 kDa heat shock protein [Fusarium oxysporum f. sp. rapae]